MRGLKTFDDIEVKLVGLISNPFEVSVASARTCYSGRGSSWPSEVSTTESAKELRDKIASSTREAGHLTTRQHAHFVFALSGVSRQFIWNFLHSHPYYNSEQVSQRYVKVKPQNYIMPPLSERATTIYEKTVQSQMESYEALIRILRDPISQDFFDRFRARRAHPEKWITAIDKRAYEVARYVLGVGTTAYLYHTVSSLTLLRYYRLMNSFDTPTEQRVVVGKMIEEVKKQDPLFEKDLCDPLPLEETQEFEMLGRLKDNPQISREFIQQFDDSLGNRISKLVSYSQGAERVLADSIRIMTGRTSSEISDAEALQMVLDPKLNRGLADTLNPATMDRLSQTLHHVQFTFYKKLSHTADSQDQRHRTVLSSRPLLRLHYSGRPDFVTPFGVTQSDAAMEVFTKCMEQSFSAIHELLEMGVDTEFTMYLLPNAASIRLVTSGDLSSYIHKWKLRSCYNSQEEIFRATVDELQQVGEVYPKLTEHLRAPCYLRERAGIKPYCPEGERFCGLPVWKYKLEQYQRKSL